MKFLAFTVLLIVANTARADSPTNATTSVTEAPKTNETEEVNYNAQGRSLSEIPREGRIINDEKMTIKGFIPIMGLASDDSNKDKNAPNDAAAGYLDNYMKNMAGGGGAQNEANEQQKQQALMDLYNNLPQHVAKPEDQRFIGAALQGLLGNSNLLSKLQKPARKSDCVCVPFYMCKNGRIVESGAHTDMTSLYQQQQHYRPEPNRYRPPVAETYLPINERSNDEDESAQNNVSCPLCSNDNVIINLPPSPDSIQPRTHRSNVGRQIDDRWMWTASNLLPA